MNLPKVVTSLIEAQNSHDSDAYIKNFSPMAIVHDEGKTHKGKEEIKQWIAHSNSQYQAFLKPLGYKVGPTESLLTAEVSGAFPGSPAVLQFHMQLDGDLIKSLKITG